MALASQSYRPARSSSRNRGLPLGRLALAAAAIVVVAGGWWMWRAPEEPTDDDGMAGAVFPQPTIDAPVPTAESLDPPAAIDRFARGELEPIGEYEDESEGEGEGDESTTVPTTAPTTTETTRDADSDAGAPAGSDPTADAQADERPDADSQPDASTPPSTPSGNGFDGTPVGRGSAPAAATGDGFAQGLALAASDPVRARALLSSALLSGALSPRDAKEAADTLVRIGRDLTLTPVLNANDPTFFRYEVQSGDSLQKIVRKHKLGCDWRLVQRINNIRRPEAIRVGQKLKLPKAPFSAVVWKRDYRIDLCIGTGDDRVVFASLPVGLGSSNGTPTGRFRVRAGSKLLDPEWRHPVTGEYFASDDPKNPIGEHWLGLEGIDASNQDLLGYGIHGTIDIDSIGQDRSLGCVRLLADDVALVWETLGDGCAVEIRP
jgi:LysM repeat protein